MINSSRKPGMLLLIIIITSTSLKSIYVEKTEIRKFFVILILSKMTNLKGIYQSNENYPMFFRSYV